MENHDFSNLGRQIQDTVQRAVDSLDFEQLNQTINQTVNQALYEAQLHKERIQRQYEENRMNQQYKQTYQKPRPNYNAAEYKANYEKPVAKKQKMNMVLAPKVKKGVLRIVFGTIGASCSWWLFLYCLIDFLNIIAEDGLAVAVILAVVTAVPALASAGILISGIRACKQYRYAKKYAKILDGRGFCEIKELADGTGRTEAQVRKSLKRLIQKGVFKEAYMDRQETCLMVSKETYDYYLQAEASLRQREEERAKEKEAEEAIAPEIQEMIQKGNAYIRTIREANDDIPGEVISEKLDRLEVIVRRIFDSVKKHPEQKKEMDKFMEYYMPTTLKLVNAYREFDALEVKGPNVQNAMNEIENTLDTITAAFEKLLDDLFQDAAFDVAADISVLQTMLAREGYKEKDFK